MTNILVDDIILIDKEGNMKKFLKAAALSLAIVPCALVMTACGGDKGINVDTKGDYAAVETAEYANVLSDLQTRGLTSENLLGGAKLTLDLGADIDMGGVKMNVELASSLQVKNSSESGVDVNYFDLLGKQDISMTTSAGGEVMKANGSAYTYLTQGSMYVNLSDAEEVLANFGLSSQLPSLKFSQKLATGDPSQDVAEIPTFDITSVLQYIPEEVYGTGFLLETSESENDYKVKVTLNGEFMQEFVPSLIAENNPELASTLTFNSFGDIIIYVVCNDEGLVGVNVTGSVDMTIAVTMQEGQEPMPVNIKGNVELNMIGYDGEFDYPTDLNEESYPPIDSVESGQIGG